jgi:hypothetical protein
MLKQHVPTQRSLWSELWPREIWRRYILYNPAIIRALGVVNRLRLPYADIPFILWPPARAHFDAIVADIGADDRVLGWRDYRIAPDRFVEFVRRIYAIDNASPVKIGIKLENLVREPLEIRVLTVRFQRPNMEVQDALNTLRCKDAHRVKEAIRAKYRDLVEDYIFDIVIHSSETTVQGASVMALVERYGAPMSEPSP